MRRRVLAMLAGLGLAVFGLVGLAGPAQAAGVPAQVTFTGCQGPDSEVSKPAAQAAIADINPAHCLDIQLVDKCDGTTVITMTNWAFNDNKFTVLTVEILGKEYTLKGGSDPNTEVVTVGPPGVEDLQIKLVFRVTTPQGEITIKRNYGEPWTWELPEACPTASPSPSVTPSASTPAPTTAAPSTSAPVVAPNDNPDLPVTGAALQGTLWTGGALMLAVGAIIAFLVIRRRRDTISE